MNFNFQSLKKFRDKEKWAFQDMINVTVTDEFKQPDQTMFQILIYVQAMLKRQNQFTHLGHKLGAKQLMTKFTSGSFTVARWTSWRCESIGLSDGAGCAMLVSYYLKSSLACSMSFILCNCWYAATLSFQITT